MKKGTKVAKIIFEFDKFEDKEDIQLVMKSGDYYSMLFEIAQYTRSLDKYEERTSLPTEEVIDKIRELMSDFTY